MLRESATPLADGSRISPPAGVCNNECNNKECGFDGYSGNRLGDCSLNQILEACEPRMVQSHVDYAKSPATTEPTLMAADPVVVHGDVKWLRIGTSSGCILRLAAVGEPGGRSRATLVGPWGFEIGLGPTGCFPRLSIRIPELVDLRVICD